ncbi:MAG: DHHA1 domain-containing protein, partial [Bdellovibrionaceae bacterium]|nr:DHHA1 domain-containing protein [Pseudobdellovibrionaceae bacterium]
IIRLLKIPLDPQIAKALYTSVTFDTQLYRFIRNSPKSHLIAARLLRYDIQPEEVHRHLFSHQTVDKIEFLAKVFSNIEYYSNGILACVTLSKKDLDYHRLTFDEVRDITDQIMSIESIEVALVIRQDTEQSFKVSLRSKGIIEVLSAAESIGGGGHWYAAGGNYVGQLTTLKSHLINHLTRALDEVKLKSAASN